MATNNSPGAEIDRLFDVAEFIPPEILMAVRKTLFAAKRKHSLNHETFKDLTQTCLMKTWKEERKFQTAGPAYFGRLVNNTVMDYCREGAKLSRATVDLDEANLASLDVEIMTAALQRMYSKSEIDDLINGTLDEEESAVIMLRFFQGFTIYQISIHLDMSVSTVKRRHRDALMKLRNSLKPRPLPPHERLEVNESIAS